MAVGAAAKAEKSQERFENALRKTGTAPAGAVPVFPRGLGTATVFLEGKQWQSHVGAAVEGQASFIVGWPQRPLSDSAYIVLRQARERILA